MGKLNRITEWRVRRDMTLETLAERAGISTTYLWRMENGERNVSLKNLTKIAEALDINKSDLIDERGILTTVRIVGLAGASVSDQVLFDCQEQDLGEAPMPPGGTKMTVAVEIRGSSMRGVGDDGWLFYFEDRREPITDDLLGELCIVGLEDGRVLIKIPHRGSAPGLFHLESRNAAMLADQRIVWAALITAIIPARAAQKILKRERAVAFPPQNRKPQKLSAKSN